jgi:hypothetical protein
MPRLHYVKKARFSKKPRKCRRCQAVIKQGDAYYWFANRIGRASIRKDFCTLHRPKQSDMTTSDKLARLYEARETVEGVLKGSIARCDWDDYRSEVSAALRECAETAREVGSEYEESRNNMPEGLQDSGTGAEIEEKAQSCESWADELEQAADDIDSTDAPEPDEPEEPEEGEDAPEGEEEDVDTSEIDGKAEDALGSLEL